MKNPIGVGNGDGKTWSKKTNRQTFGQYSCPVKWEVMKSSVEDLLPVENILML